MAELVQVLYDGKRVTADTADKAKLQFSNLCRRASDDLRSTFSSYNTSHRLESFYYTVMGTDTESAELWSVVRKVLVLSHGNANVESGFSVNKDILVENLTEQSMVAQRVVYDGKKAAGGVLAVSVTKGMMHSVRAARSRYDDALRRNREAASEEEKKAGEKKRIASEIKSLEAKKAKLIREVASDKEMIESQIKDLQSRMH